MKPWNQTLEKKRQKTHHLSKHLSSMHQIFRFTQKWQHLKSSLFTSQNQLNRLLPGRTWIFSRSRYGHSTRVQTIFIKSGRPKVSYIFHDSPLLIHAVTTCTFCKEGMLIELLSNCVVLAKCQYKSETLDETHGPQWTPMDSSRLWQPGSQTERNPLLNICLLCLYIVFRRVLEFQTSPFSKLDNMLEVRLASTPPDLCPCFFFPAMFSDHTSDAGDMSTAWEFLDEICRFSQRQASGSHLLGGGW